MPASVDEQLRTLAAGAVDVISTGELKERLARGQRLRVKLGLDPTASDLHLGNAVVLRKLRQFQDLGHLAVLILGDFTAQVGDPTGKSVTRPRLTREEVEAHASTYVEQLGAVLDLDPDRVEVRKNSEWLSTMGIEDVLRLTAGTTVAQMLERDDFRQRHAAGAPISIIEFLYPLLQGWDSVMVRADVELGGTDQLFNNLMGRELQRDNGQEPQVVLTMPLLEGTDGVQKMSKSLGNAIGVAEPPGEQFGRLMAVPDSLLDRYLALTTGWGPDRVEELVNGRRSGSIPAVEVKRLLARTVVDLYHGEGAGAAAEAEFNRVFRSHEAPLDMAEVEIGRDDLHGGRILVARLLQLGGLVASNAEGRRKIAEGGVRMNGGRIDDPAAELEPSALDGAVLQVGRRKWVRLRWKP